MYYLPAVSTFNGKKASPPNTEVVYKVLTVMRMKVTEGILVPIVKASGQMKSCQRVPQLCKTKQGTRKDISTGKRMAFDVDEFDEAAVLRTV